MIPLIMSNYDIYWRFKVSVEYEKVHANAPPIQPEKTWSFTYGDSEPNPSHDLFQPKPQTFVP